MHYVLEGVSREIKETVGFKNADEEMCRSLTGRYIESYVHEALYDFEGASARFIYLFRRLGEEVMRVVLDMLEEVKRSDFSPLDFELDISDIIDQPAHNGSGLQGSPAPVLLSLQFRGIVDRVDGWTHDGKFYLRVVDYKSRQKTLDLSDVLYGRNMQMLIYLFALQQFGSARYNAEITPAGVLYVPALDVIVNAPRNATDDYIQIEREKKLRRSGLILNDPLVVDAMENGDHKKYLPVKSTKEDGISGNSLADQEQIGLLAKYVGYMLKRASTEIAGGRIDCRPYYKNPDDHACSHCEFSAVCGFDEETGDRRRYNVKQGYDEIWEMMAAEVEN